MTNPKNSILIQGISPQELQNQINEGIKIQLQQFLKHFAPTPPKEYLTRKNVADMFQVNLSTVHHWSKSGKIKPLGIGSRVYYLRSDIEAILTPLT
jgi:hypothetical protein